MSKETKLRVSGRDLKIYRDGELYHASGPEMNHVCFAIPCEEVEQNVEHV